LRAGARQEGLEALDQVVVAGKELLDLLERLLGALLPPLGDVIGRGGLSGIPTGGAGGLGGLVLGDDLLNVLAEGVVVVAQHLEELLVRLRLGVECFLDVVGWLASSTLHGRQPPGWELPRTWTWDRYSMDRPMLGLLA
jgi:hypothetical protein